MPLPSSLLNKIQKIQLKMDHLSEELLSGPYHSAFKGQGIEFEEVRPFQEGDAKRSIDWNVTARMGKPFIKLFEEERKGTVMLLMDISQSTSFGSQGISKEEWITEIGALLAWSAIKNQDKIGLILFSDQIELYIPPKSGSKQVLRLIREMISPTKKSKKTDLSKALQHFGKVQQGKSICFVLSDFLTPPFVKALKPLAKKHKMIAFCIRDPLEDHFVDLGLVKMRDLERNTFSLIDTHSEEVQKALKKSYSERLQTHQKTFQNFGCSWVDFYTSQPYIETLLRFFRAKKKRIR